MKKFKILYADPPWCYRNMGNIQATANAQYDIMQQKDLEALPVEKIVDDNSILFLWATFPKIQEALNVIKAWGFCCAVGTKILTNDLQWKPAELLKVGDKLVGFDDNRRKSKTGRYFRRYFDWSTVLSTGIKYDQCYEIIFSDGSKVTSNGEHKWISKTKIGNQSFDWHSTIDLYKLFKRKISIEFWKIAPVYEQDFSYESGFLAGAFDGEGNIRTTDSLLIQFAQKDNDMLKNVKKFLKEKGFNFSVYKYLDKPTRCVSIRGKREETLKLLMKTRPPRLMKRWLNHNIKIHSLYNLPKVRVKEIRFVGVKPIVSLTTSTGTYIAEGYGAHNTYKTVGITWVKTNTKNNKPFFGVGWYMKSNAEICLIGVKGKAPKVSNSVSSIIISPRQKHSQKPSEAKKRIVEFCGDVPRLEMFARKTSLGWTAIGNEIDGMDIKDSLNKLII